jgi:hypothetical protein
MVDPVDYARTKDDLETVPAPCGRAEDVANIVESVIVDNLGFAQGHA